MQSSRSFTARFYAYSFAVLAHSCLMQIKDNYAVFLILACRMRAGVKGVLRVLAGNEAAVQQPTVHWLEAAVAHLLHSRPQLQLQSHTAALLNYATTKHPPPAGVLQLLYTVMMVRWGLGISGVGQGEGTSGKM